MSSILKKKKTKAPATLSKSDIDFYRMTGVFAVVCIFVLLALNMQGSVTEHIASGKDLTYNFYKFCRTPWFFGTAGLLLVTSLGWFSFSKIKKIDESKRIFTSTSCLVLTAYLAFFVACFGVRYPSNNHSFFIIATIFTSLIYFASHFYGMDFIMYSIVTAVMSLCIFLYAMIFDPYAIVIKVSVAAACLIGTVLFNLKIGSLKISKQKKASFLKFPMYISLCLGTLFLFWAATSLQQSLMFLNRNLMLMFVLIQYVAFAIVYTIRRIKD